MDGESIRKTRRRQKLNLLVREQGGPSQVERDTGTKKSYLSAIAHGKRGLGDALAARLEKEYGKPAGWFDQPEGGSWPFSIELQQEVENLAPEELPQLERSIWVGFLRKEVPATLHYPGSDEGRPEDKPKPSSVRDVKPRPSPDVGISSHRAKG